MIVKCVVACVNANGSSDFFFVKVDCTPEDYEQGRHCEAAELYACNQDYGEPMVTFDPDDPPGESLMDLFIWETASCINLDGEEISPPAQVEAPVAQSPAENLFEVWTEGYRASGDSGVAEFHGKFPGKTFEEAVAKYRDSLPPARQGNVNLERMTYWGCKFFDNEADARKRYG